MSLDDPFSVKNPFSTVVPFHVPEQMRVFAEQGVAQAREGYQRLKQVAETNNGALEAIYNSATQGATDFTTKVIDIARVNTESAFLFAQNLMGAKSPMEAIQLMNVHARRQFDILTAQSQELAALTQKVASGVTEPAKTGTAAALKDIV